MSPDEELLPCPWCGAAVGAIVEHGSTFRWRAVVGCCTPGPDVRHATTAEDQDAAEADSKRRAIAAWNTRAGCAHVEDKAATATLQQALSDPENQPNQFGITFGMRGRNMYFAIGSQQFLLAHEPNEPGDFEFMRDALISAMSIFTPDVKMASETSLRERLHKFLNAAAGEGVEFDGVDAADLYVELFPDEYAATIAKMRGE